VEDVDSGNSLENADAKESKETKDECEKDDKEEDSGGKENEEDVVNVDELELDDMPLAHWLGESMAKRLRSNKGKAVLSENKNPKKKTTGVTDTPKSKTKSTSVGPKKGWSKVTVKNDVGSSRKRKAVSSSDSEYDAEMDVLNGKPSESKKADGKKDLVIVEDVPIEKVSFHLPCFVQRWKFVYHKRLALERE